MRISTPRTPRTSLTRSSRGPEWVGTAHAPSPDVRCGHPGLRLLGADFAPLSLAPLVSYAGSRSMSSPFRGSVSGKQGKEGKEKEGKGQASSKEREKGEGKGQASSKKSREKDRHLPGCVGSRGKAGKKAEKGQAFFALFWGPRIWRPKLRPEWVGTAHAPSPDVRCGHPGLRSLGADFAPPSWLRWSATPALGA